MRPIRRTAIVVTVLVGLGAVALLAGTQLGGNQPGQPNFETGSLPVTVENEPAVLVTNEPIVRAQQFGDWTVRLSDERSRERTVTLSGAQVARLTMPGFVEAGVTYTFVWPDGSTEAHLVVALANSGWVQVEGESGSLKWVNASADGVSRHSDRGSDRVAGGQAQVVRLRKRRCARDILCCRIWSPASLSITKTTVVTFHHRPRLQRAGHHRRGVDACTGC